MPPEPADVVRANSAAFNAMDADAMLAFYDADAVVEDCRDVGWGTHRGHEDLRAYYLGIFDNAAALEERLEILGRRDDVVVTHCDLRAQLAAPAGEDGSEFTTAYGLVITVRDGLIARIEIHRDGQAALAASRGG
jgi:hypothetical protein